MENQFVIAIRTNTETAPALEVAKPTLQVTLWCDSFLGGSVTCCLRRWCQEFALSGPWTGSAAAASHQQVRIHEATERHAMPLHVVEVYELNV